MLLQEEQPSDFSPVHMNFPDSLAGQSLIALLNVVVHFSERQGKDSNIFGNNKKMSKKNVRLVIYAKQKGSSRFPIYIILHVVPIVILSQPIGITVLFGSTLFVQHNSLAKIARNL